MYWRQVVSQELCASGGDSDSFLTEKARVRESRNEIIDYQMEHARLIFDEGLSFSGFERNKVFLGREGMRYLDVSDVSGADSELDCRATLVADFDDDGDADLFVNSIQRELHLLYRNDLGTGPDRRFVKVRLRATSGHPDAIGATVRLRTPSGIQAQVLSCGTGFESQNALELIFGLGSHEEGSISVHWPGRAIESFGKVPASGRYRLVEGSGQPEPYAARTFAFGEPLPPGLRIAPGDSPGTLKGLTLEGQPRPVELGEGRRTLLNFWATTCRSCVQELPLLDELGRRPDLDVIAISLDPPSASEEVSKLWSRLSLTLPVARLTAAEADRLFDLSRLPIPLSIIVDGSGKIERIIQGKIRPDQI